MAQLAERALRAAGGFDQRPIPGTRLASLGQLRGNAGALWQSLVLLFGANNPGTPKRAITISNHVPLVLSADLHVIGLVAAGAGLVAGIAAGFFGWPGPAGHVSDASQAGRPSWPRRASWADRDRVDQILVVAIGVTIAAALVSTVMMQSLANAHEIAILLPLGAALAGRTLPSSARPLAERIVRTRAAAVPTRATVTTAATVALAGWLAVGLAEAGFAATCRPPGCRCGTWPPGSSPTTSTTAWPPTGRARKRRSPAAAGCWWRRSPPPGPPPTTGRRRPPGTSRVGTGRRSSSPNSIPVPRRTRSRSRASGPASAARCEYHVGGDLVPGLPGTTCSPPARPDLPGPS